MIPVVASLELADLLMSFVIKVSSRWRTQKDINGRLKYGLIAKIHANELDYSGGIQGRG